MAFQPVPDTAQFTFFFDGVVGSFLEGLKAAYSVYCRDTVQAWDDDALIDVAEALRTHFQNDGAELMSNAWILAAIQGKDLEVELGAKPVIGAGDVGTRAGEPSPPSVTALAQIRGNFGGKPQRGWIHLPFGVEADLQGERWTSSFTTAVETYVDGFGPVMSGVAITHAWCLVSRHEGTAPDPNALIAVKRASGITNTIRDSNCRALIGSQRDRRT